MLSAHWQTTGNTHRLRVCSDSWGWNNQIAALWCADVIIRWHATGIMLWHREIICHDWNLLYSSVKTGHLFCTWHLVELLFQGNEKEGGVDFKPGLTQSIRFEKKRGERLKDGWRGFGVGVEILSVKYLGYFRARCKKDRMAGKMKGAGVSHQHVPSVVNPKDKCKLWLCSNLFAPSLWCSWKYKELYIYNIS